MQSIVDYSKQYDSQNSWRKIAFEASALLIFSLLFAQTALRILAQVR